MPSKPTFLGTVEDVSGASISVALSSETAAGLTFISGVAYRIGQVGAFVRIPIGYLDLFGIVTQVGAGAVPERVALAEPHGHRWMTVELIGEGERQGDFQRGLSQSPAVGDPVHLVTVEDLSRIYGHHGNPRFVKVGTLASAESIPAYVNVDKLVTRHSAVLGATGSGKSTTVASLLGTLSDASRYPSARIIVFDVHGEYGQAFRGSGTVFRINARQVSHEQQLHVPFWAIPTEDLIPLAFGQLDDSARGAVMDRILDAKRRYATNHPDLNISVSDVTADTPLPFSLRQLWLDLHTATKGTHTTNDGQSTETLAYELDLEGTPMIGNAETLTPPRFRPEDKTSTPKIYYSKQQNLISGRSLEVLATKLRDPRLNFLFRPGPWDVSPDGEAELGLDVFLHRWLGESHPVVVLDLSGVPVSTLNPLIGAMLRIIYDALFWSRDLAEGGRERPVLLVLEEAHLYLGKNASGGASSQAGQAVRRIAKEGRKYGIGAMIVSQRPSEVDDTILSQCGTIFALRMSNESDRSHVTGAVTDSLKGLLSNLPILRTGEAIIVGEAVQLPMRALIQAPPPDRRPDSEDPVIFGGKFDEGERSKDRPGGWEQQRTWDKSLDFRQMVEVWRLQRPRPITRNSTSHEASSD